MSDFDGHEHARNTDPVTSWDARHNSFAKRTMAKEALMAHGMARYGLTDDELWMKWFPHYKINSLNRARGVLRERGYVVDSGEKRPGTTGCGQIVWKLTGEGVAKVNELRGSGVSFPAPPRTCHACGRPYVDS